MKRSINKEIIYGIQGGIGSFNEEAILTYTKKKDISNFKIKYLYTTEKVLRNLQNGKIDYGLFAIHNSVGGIVEESIQAMANYRFKIVEEFEIPIRHFLMKRKNVDIKDIDTIITHPQVLKQCKSTLSKKYSHLKKTSGKGDMIDHAAVAKVMAQGKLPGNIAVMGPKTLSDIYDLEIIAENLQDDKTNNTSFLLVRKC